MRKILMSVVLLSAVLAGCDSQSESFSMLPGKKPAATDVKTLKPRALMILENSLKHDNPAARANAVEIVVETGRKELMSRIIQLLEDPSVPVRFSAAVAIGDMECFGCQQQVGPLLNDSDENVRIAAAYAMVKLNQPKFHDLVVAATNSTDQTVRANAALLIGKMGNKDDLKLLYDMLGDANSMDKARIQSVESIARLGDESIYRSKLWALQISKYADDRVMGIRGMGALGTPEAKKAIGTMLIDDVPEVRLAAAEQLGRFGIQHGEDEVYDYFQTQPDLNKVDMANGMAVMAIGRLNSPRLNTYLPEALNSQSPYIRMLAAQSVLLITK
ncbi:MAG: HEAT repeat domain-containing protein [Planctomycetota bacterium]|jgi:HEAT repeat protein